VNVTCPDCQSVFRVDPTKVPVGGVRARCSVCGGVIAVGVTRATPPRPAAAIAEQTAPRVPQPAVAEPHAADAQQAPVQPPSAAPAPAEAPRRAPTPAAPTPAVPTPAAPRPAVEPPAAPRDTLWRSPDAVPAARFGAGAPSATPVAPREHDQPRVQRTPTPTASIPATPSPSPAASAGPAIRRPVNPYLSTDPGQKARRLARALVSDLVAYHPQRREEGLRTGALKQLFREEIKKSYEEYVEQVGTELAESTPYFRDALNDVLAGGRKVF
jgi:predicted Zn finger-like uncharacterized protein